MYKYYLSVSHTGKNQYIPIKDKVFFLESKCKEYFDIHSPKHINGKPVHMIKENIETGEVFILSNETDKWDNLHIIYEKRN